MKSYYLIPDPSLQLWYADYRAGKCGGQLHAFNEDGDGYRLPHDHHIVAVRMNESQLIYLESLPDVLPLPCLIHPKPLADPAHAHPLKPHHHAILHALKGIDTERHSMLDIAEKLAKLHPWFRPTGV